MDYNDEILCPEIYQEMAKEYQKNSNKQLNNSKILYKLFDCFDELNNNIIYLNNLKNISPTSKTYLIQINNFFDELKSLYPDFDFTNKKINSNYCECLTKGIYFCTDCIKEISCLNSPIAEINNILNILANIIERFSCMYGICRYRNS